MTADTYGLAALIGAVAPFIIALVIQSTWREQAKAAVAFLICVVIAAVTSFFADGVDLKDPGVDWVTWFGVIYGSAMTLYARLYKPTGVAPAVEHKTNLN